MLELGEVSLGTYPLSSALALTGAAINITNAIIIQHPYTINQPEEDHFPLGLIAYHT